MNAQNLKILGDILFYFFGILTIGGAIYVLIAKNVLYAAYGLLVTFLGVAAMFVFAGAEFVAASQIMVYVGGILVLLIFGIMLSTNKKSDKNYLKIKTGNLTLGVSISVALFFVLLIIGYHLSYPKVEKISPQSIKNIGFELMTSSVLPLEIIGLLLLFTLIGATYIAKSDE